MEEEKLILTKLANESKAFEEITSTPFKRLYSYSSSSSSFKLTLYSLFKSFEYKSLLKLLKYGLFSSTSILFKLGILLKAKLL